MVTEDKEGEEEEEAKEEEGVKKRRTKTKVHGGTCYMRRTRGGE